MFYLQIDDELKTNTELVLEQLGLDLNGAVNIFCRQVVLKRGLPFEIMLPENLNRMPIVESPPRIQKESYFPEFEEEELKKESQAFRLLVLMRELCKKGILTENGLFKRNIEKHYRERFPWDHPKDLAQALSDGCTPKYAGKLGVVYERVFQDGKTRTGIYRLR